MDNQEKDSQLWRLAKKRVSFKWSFTTYVFVNTLLIAAWFFTSGVGTYFWPFWSMIGWGIGIAFQYISCYHNNNIFPVQAEYENLKKQNL